MSIFRKDDSKLGAILGAILPLVFAVIFYQLDAILVDNGHRGFRLSTIFVLAILSNIIPFVLFNKFRNGYSMRGVMSATVVYVIAWVIYFYMIGAI